MLVSEARNQKNLQDARADYQSEKLRERNEQIIKYYQSKIEEEKEAIKNCLDQNFFLMAKSRVHRIQEMIAKINHIRQSN